MRARPATAADVVDLLAAQRRCDVHWFGNPEHDEDEFRESFDRVELLVASRVLLNSEKLLGGAWWWDGDDSTLVVDPAVDLAPVYDDLLPWLASCSTRSVEALDRDTVLHEALRRHMWEYQHSSYELIRSVEGWELEAPSWPAGVRVASLGPQDAQAVHRLIYDGAGWADVPGHVLRPFAQWQSLFLSAEVLPDQQVLAWRDGRLVGVALGKTFSDGTGWVSQLAVARDVQGQGLGRALLLEALHRRTKAGATQLGLGVSAANAGALRLYTGVGLVVDREWRKHRPATVALA